MSAENLNQVNCVRNGEFKPNQNYPLNTPMPHGISSIEVYIRNVGDDIPNIQQTNDPNDCDIYNAATDLLTEFTESQGGMVEEASVECIGYCIGCGRNLDFSITAKKEG